MKDENVLHTATSKNQQITTTNDSSSKYFKSIKIQTEKYKIHKPTQTFKTKLALRNANCYATHR